MSVDLQQARHGALPGLMTADDSAAADQAVSSIMAGRSANVNEVVQQALQRRSS